MDTESGQGGAAGAGEEPGDAEDQDASPPRVHYSTGRLTPAQAAIVDAWRARLREDKPLPGHEPVGPVLRMLGITDHPKASCSDAIAAAVAELLRQAPPAPLELAGYAYKAIRAQWEDGQGRPRPDAPACPPVSFYLPPALAAQAEALRAEAPSAASRKLDDLDHEAAELYPVLGGDTAAAERSRARFTGDQVRRLGLYYTRQVPRGALARMAIDRWARRGPDRVAATAADWASEHHDQPHRARSDMHKLTRLNPPDPALATVPRWGT